MLVHPAMGQFAQIRMSKHFVEKQITVNPISRIMHTHAHMYTCPVSIYSSNWVHRDLFLYKVLAHPDPLYSVQTVPRQGAPT